MSLPLSTSPSTHISLYPHLPLPTSPSTHISLYLPLYPSSSTSPGSLSFHFLFGRNSKEGGLQGGTHSGTAALGRKPLPQLTRRPPAGIHGDVANRPAAFRTPYGVEASRDRERRRWWRRRRRQCAERRKLHINSSALVSTHAATRQLIRTGDPPPVMCRSSRLVFWRLPQQALQN